MSCKFVVNGTESKLYNDILTVFNGDEELSKALHSSFAKDKEFIKDFGDWDNAYKNSYENLDNNLSYIDRTEDNGEPKLYKNEKTGDWYYLDKDYETALQNFSIVKNGYTEKDVKVMDYLNVHGEVGIENICSYLQCSRHTFLHQVEPYLLSTEMILRTKKGRIISTKGIDFLSSL